MSDFDEGPTNYVPVGWAARFDSGQIYLTTHSFESNKWRDLGMPVWPVFARNDCMCAACSRKELHSSDCAVHNAPAMPAGECTCAEPRVEALPES
jgi:hypothetical protein